MIYILPHYEYPALLPSGELTYQLKMAIEIVDLPINSMVIFHCYVNFHQRVIYEYTAPNISKPSERSLRLPVLLPHAAELLPLPAPLAPDQSLLAPDLGRSQEKRGKSMEIDDSYWPMAVLYYPIWQCVKTNSSPVVHIKIAGLKWMWITH